VNPARLAAIPLFAGLGDDDLSLLAGAAREVAVDAGETLAVQGQPGHAMYAIESGTADVIADGARRAILRPGDIFGEIAMLATGHRTASVVATSPMRLIALVTDALEERSPEAAARLRDLADGRRRGGS
jgi:CRP-like cAMP-binding protein